MQHFNRLRKWALAAGAALAASVIAIPAIAASAQADDLASFINTYDCSVVELLNRIHAHPDMKSSDRFLVLDPVHQLSNYVQCAFDDNDRFMMCEAASGFYAAAGEAPRFSPAQRQALVHLGFSADGSHGNFQHYFRIGSPAEYVRIADMLLTALYEGYDVRLRDVIEAEAPFALRRRGVLRRDRCVPIS